MTDKIISQFNEVSSVSDTDLFLLENDPTGTPSYKKISGANLKASAGRYHGVESIGTISFDNSTHVLTLSSVTYWYKGTQYTTASPVTCDLDLTADRDHASATLTANTLYYVRFKDATGKLYWSPSLWDLHETIPVVTVFWNGSAGAVSKESHGYSRNIDWHVWAHLTIGTRYGAGLTLTYPTTAVDGSLQIESGTIYDEDLTVTISQQTTMRGYYQASAGVYTFADYALPYLGTSGAPVYLDTDTYALTTFASNRYGCYWVFATSDIVRTIAIIPTHINTIHSTITAARAEVQPSISGVNPEWKLIYRFIYTGDGQLQESTDYRLQTSIAGGVSASTTAGAVSFTPSGNISSTTVQTAIEELDTEKSATSHTHSDATTGTAGFMSATDKTKLDGLANGLTYQVISTNTTAVKNNGYLINASSGNVTLTLPSTPSAGDTVAVSDAYNKATTNVITVARNGSKIDGLSENIVIDILGAGFILVYADSTIGWKIVSEISGNVYVPTNVAITGGTVDGTTIKTSNITVGSGKTLDVSAGTLTLADDQISGSKINGYMGKNAIINGNFDIWQRGTSFSSVANGAYCVDRWRKDGATGGVTISQDTDVPTQAQSGIKSSYSLKTDVTTSDSSVDATDFLSLRYTIEGYDYRQFVGRVATLSFWAKSVKAGTYCIVFASSNNDMSYVAEYTIAQANTWEKKTVTVTFNYSGGTWDYATGVGLRVYWVLVAGSNYQTTKDTWQSGTYLGTSSQVNFLDSTDNNFWLSQVQLELGPVATDFECRPYGLEMVLCQRYFEKTFDDSIAPAQNTSNYNGCIVANANGTGEGAILCNWEYKVAKRAVPTITFYAVTEASTNWTGTGSVPSVADFTGIKRCRVRSTGGTISDNGGYLIHATASSEL